MIANNGITFLTFETFKTRSTSNSKSDEISLVSCLVHVLFLLFLSPVVSPGCLAAPGYALWLNFSQPLSVAETPETTVSRSMNSHEQPTVEPTSHYQQAEWVQSETISFLIFLGTFLLNFIDLLWSTSNCEVASTLLWRFFKRAFAAETDKVRVSDKTTFNIFNHQISIFRCIQIYIRRHKQLIRGIGVLGRDDFPCLGRKLRGPAAGPVSGTAEGALMGTGTQGLARSMAGPFLILSRGLAKTPVTPNLFIKWIFKSIIIRYYKKKIKSG